MQSNNKGEQPQELAQEDLIAGAQPQDLYYQQQQSQQQQSQVQYPQLRRQNAMNFRTEQQQQQQQQQSQVQYPQLRRQNAMNFRTEQQHQSYADRYEESKNNGRDWQR
jgi:hypothetical protein